LSAETRRVRDRWREKSWCSVVSPPYFGGVEVGSVPCNDPSEMEGRVVETTLYGITGDFSQSNLKLYFQVSGVKGARADTVFKGHEYSRDYLRSLVRRGSSRVDGIFDATTKDGYTLRVSIVIFPVARVRSSQRILLRQLMQNKVQEKVERLNFDQLVQEMVLDKIASEIYNEGKKICPLRHVGVRKSKLLLLPKEGEPREKEVKPVPEEGEDTAEPSEREQ